MPPPQQTLRRPAIDGDISGHASFGGQLTLLSTNPYFPQTYRPKPLQTLVFGRALISLFLATTKINKVMNCLPPKQAVSQ
jgi:hypothetical protein